MVKRCPIERSKDCEHCGQQFKRRSDKPDARFCSRPCVTQARRQTPLSRRCGWCAEEFRLDPKNARQQFCSGTCSRAATRKPQASKVYIIECGACSGLFVARYVTRLNCYDPGCMRRRNVAKVQARRAQRLGLGNRRITLDYLIERDGSRCGICRRLVRAKTGPMRPSIDHIIPLSLGGTHELVNVQLSHARCNYRKNNRGCDQLLLVG